MASTRRKRTARSLARQEAADLAAAERWLNEQSRQQRLANPGFVLSDEAWEHAPTYCSDPRSRCCACGDGYCCYHTAGQRPALDGLRRR